MLDIKKHSSDSRDVLGQFVQQGWESQLPKVFLEQVRQASIQSDVGGVDSDLGQDKGPADFQRFFFPYFPTETV